MALGFKPHSPSLIVSGCFILFCDWLFFNAGSAFTITQDKVKNIPALTVINTILSAVGSAACLTLLSMIKTSINSTKVKDITLKFDLITLVGAVMAGCVSATAACNNITPTSAVLIGVCGGIVYKLTVDLLLKLEIDDPLQVSQIHGFCGFWGLIATGICDLDTGLIHSGSFW